MDDDATLLDRALSGDRRALARVITLVELRRASIVAALGRATVRRRIGPGRPHVVGLTGPPGAGKSTLVDALVARGRARGERVGVIAVDPSSPFTGGAILGDRIRMERHTGDDGVFVRSLSSRGHAGGLSASAAQVVDLLDAAGFDTVLVETVGVGQGEIGVMEVADTVAVVLTPESGDAVQAMKAGLLEVADVFAVNKADRPGADAVVRELERTVALGVSDPAAVQAGEVWAPPVRKVTAATGEGLDALCAALDAHVAWCSGPGRAAWAERRGDARLRAALDDVAERARRAARRRWDAEGLTWRIRAGEPPEPADTEPLAPRGDDVTAIATAAPPTRPSLPEAKRALLDLGGGNRKGAVNLRFESANALGTARTVARLEIDHPEARSAISLSMMCDLADAVLQLQQWAGALVIVSSTDRRAFCSGGHLGEIPHAIGPGPGAAAMARAMTAVLDALLDLPQITVAAIDGVAIGGGAELATATDFRVAGAEARIHFVHGRLGIAPGWGGTGRLVRIIGRGPALRILSRGRPLLPGEAVQIGLVDHRCDGLAVDGALAWVGDVLSVEPEALRAIKRQIVAMSPIRPAGCDPEAEVAAFAEVWGGPAHRSALAAAWGTDGRPGAEAMTLVGCWCWFWLAACPRPSPPPVAPPPPPPPSPAADARVLLIGPTAWVEPDGALALDVPEGWGGSAGPPPMLLDLTQESSGFGFQLRTWPIGEDPPPRLGFALLFEDAGSYRDVPALGAEAGTRTWQADDGRTVQSWFAPLGARVVEVALTYPAGRSIEGREAVAPLLLGLRGPAAPPED